MEVSLSSLNWLAQPGGFEEQTLEKTKTRRRMDEEDNPVTGGEMDSHSQTDDPGKGVTRPAINVPVRVILCGEGFSTWDPSVRKNFLEKYVGLTSETLQQTLSGSRQKVDIHYCSKITEGHKTAIVQYPINIRKKENIKDFLKWWVNLLEEWQEKLSIIVSPSLCYDPLVKMIATATGLSSVLVNTQTKADLRCDDYKEELKRMQEYKERNKLSISLDSEPSLCGEADRVKEWNPEERRGSVPVELATREYEYEGGRVSEENPEPKKEPFHVPRSYRTTVPLSQTAWSSIRRSSTRKDTDSESEDEPRERSEERQRKASREKEAKGKEKNQKRKLSPVHFDVGKILKPMQCDKLQVSCCYCKVQLNEAGYLWALGHSLWCDHCRTLMLNAVSGILVNEGPQDLPCVAVERCLETETSCRVVWTSARDEDFRQFPVKPLLQNRYYAVIRKLWENSEKGTRFMADHLLTGGVLFYGPIMKVGLSLTETMPQLESASNKKATSSTSISPLEPTELLNKDTQNTDKVLMSFSQGEHILGVTSSCTSEVQSAEEHYYMTEPEHMATSQGPGLCAVEYNKNTQTKHLAISEQDLGQDFGHREPPSLPTVTMEPDTPDSLISFSETSVAILVEVPKLSSEGPIVSQEFSSPPVLLPTVEEGSEGQDGQGQAMTASCVLEPVSAALQSGSGGMENDEEEAESRVEQNELRPWMDQHFSEQNSHSLSEAPHQLKLSQDEIDINKMEVGDERHPPDEEDKDQYPDDTTEPALVPRQEVMFEEVEDILYLHADDEEWIMD